MDRVPLCECGKLLPGALVFLEMRARGVLAVLAICLGAAGGVPSSVSAGSGGKMFTEHTISVSQDASGYDNLGDSGFTETVLRHVKMLSHLLENTAHSPVGGFRVRVLAQAAFSDTPSGTWPPGAVALVSPWLALKDTSDGGIELTLLVSDLRIIGDWSLADQATSPEGYQQIAEIEPISYQCLGMVADRYVSEVTLGRVPSLSIFDDSCVSTVFAPHLLKLFDASPKNFFAPFDQSVLMRLEQLRADSDGFYKRLYSELVERGLNSLEAGETTTPNWWHSALAAVVE